jgi:hypothetical protein
MASATLPANSPIENAIAERIVIRGVRDMEREARKHLKRLQTLKAEMLFHRKIRKLQAGALLLKRRERCEAVN